MGVRMQWILPAVLIAGGVPFDGRAANIGCVTSEHSAEMAGCEGDALVALDLEVTRIFNLALDGAGHETEDGQQLRDWHEAWVDQVYECIEQPDSSACAVGSYAGFIHGLRKQYPAARADDANGTSLGPVDFTCAGFDHPVSAVFIAADLVSYISLDWYQDATVLPQVVSGSGALFESDAGSGGKVMFWTKGNNATFTTLDGVAHDCSVEPNG